MLIVKDVKPLEPWKDCLGCWCPAQCYRQVKTIDTLGNSKVYTLYLRWRHDDPWTGNVVEGDMTPKVDKWSKNLLSGHYFKDWEIDKAKNKLFRVAKKELLAGTLKFK